MRLMLHVGHGKTGSSWLQSWLAINSKILASKFNVKYIISSNDPSFKGHFSMGNSYILEPYLNGKIMHPSNFIDDLDPQGTLLFSGEKLMKILPSCHHRLEEIATILGTEQPEILLMLRDPFDHALSLYNQKIKSQGLKVSFSSYLPTYNLPSKILFFLRKFPTAHVFHYDNYRTKLHAPFLDLLRLPDNEWDFPLFELVNRSLSQSELKLMRLINCFLPIKASKLIGRRLTLMRPSRTEQNISSRLDTILVREFITRWRPVVDSINLLIPKESAIKLPSIDSIL